jgi:hypothetical protein
MLQVHHLNNSRSQRVLFGGFSLPSLSGRSVRDGSDAVLFVTGRSGTRGYCVKKTRALSNQEAFLINADRLLAEVDGHRADASQTAAMGT